MSVCSAIFAVFIGFVTLIFVFAVNEHNCNDLRQIAFVKIRVLQNVYATSSYPVLGDTIRHVSRN
jgi:hypothetical protein